MSESTYAIVRTGGKQYRVQPGQTLLVEKLAAQAGEAVALEPLLYRTEDDLVLDAEGLGRVSVSATVVGHERGPKIRVFKFKPKRGYKRRAGHRQSLTRLEIGKISQSAGRKRAAGAAKRSAESEPETASATMSVAESEPETASATTSKGA